jgi:AcrR family transcriptional regulator
MPRPRSDIRPRIVHAARERFLREGVDGATLRRIAEDAGTSIGMIYYYFKTKDDLFLAVVEEVYAALVDDIGVALALDREPEERIRRLYARVGAMTELELVVIRIIVREALVSSERLSRLITRMSTGHLPMAIAAVHDGVGRGAFRDDQPLPVLLTAIAATGLLPQILRRIVADARPDLAALLPPADALATGLAEVILAGVRKSG